MIHFSTFPSRLCKRTTRRNDQIARFSGEREHTIDGGFSFFFFNNLNAVPTNLVPGVNLIKRLHAGVMTRVATVSEVEDNSYTCKLHL